MWIRREQLQSRPCVSKEIHAFSGKNEHTAGQYSRFDEAEQSTRFHETELEALLADYVRASKDNNATMQALKAYMAQNIGKMTMLSIIKIQIQKTDRWWKSFRFHRL